MSTFSTITSTLKNIRKLPWADIDLTLGELGTVAQYLAYDQHFPLETSPLAYFQAGCPVVVLIPGYFGKAGSLNSLAGDLISRNYSVFVYSPKKFIATLEELTNDLVLFLDSLKNLYGIQKLSLVGHSMGGLLARKARMHYVKNNEIFIDKVATIASPHHGTSLAEFGWGPAAKQMAVGSDFLHELALEDKNLMNKTFTASATPDALVYPVGQALLDGSKKKIYANTGHLLILRCPEFLHDLRKFLGQI